MAARKKPVEAVSVAVCYKSSQGCSYNAIARLRTSKGWEDMCLAHYEAHFRELASASLLEKGLNRQPGELQVAYVRRMREQARVLLRGGVMRRMPLHNRQPGDDDE